jgi:hypothetical protein
VARALADAAGAAGALRAGAAAGVAAGTVGSAVSVWAELAWEASGGRAFVDWDAGRVDNTEETGARVEIPLSCIVFFPPVFEIRLSHNDLRQIAEGL